MQQIKQAITVNDILHLKQEEIDEFFRLVLWRPEIGDKFYSFNHEEVFTYDGTALHQVLVYTRPIFPLLTIGQLIDALYMEKDGRMTYSDGKWFCYIKKEDKWQTVRRQASVSREHLVDGLFVLLRKAIRDGFLQPQGEARGFIRIEEGKEVSYMENKFELFKDRLESLMDRWEKFVKENPDKQEFAIENFLAEVSDGWTADLIKK